MRYIVVETYFIGRAIGVNCEQMMEFALKNQKVKPCQKDLPFLKNDITNNLEPQNLSSIAEICLLRYF